MERKRILFIERNPGLAYLLRSVIAEDCACVPVEVLSPAALLEMLRIQSSDIQLVLVAYDELTSDLPPAEFMHRVQAINLNLVVVFTSDTFDPASGAEELKGTLLQSLGALVLHTTKLADELPRLARQPIEA